MAKRTLNNCSIIQAGFKNGIGKPNQYDNVCEGYCFDESGECIDLCKKCKLNKDYEV